MGTQVFEGVEVNRYIEVYKSLSSRAVTNLVVKDISITYPYCSPGRIQQTIKMADGYMKRNW